MAHLLEKKDQLLKTLRASILQNRELHKKLQVLLSQNYKARDWLKPVRQDLHELRELSQFQSQEFKTALGWLQILMNETS